VAGANAAPELSAILLSCGFMAASASYSIGVDLGGANLRAAAISRAGTLLDKISGTTNLHAGRDAVIDGIVGSIRALRERFGSAELAGVGVAVPGFIDLERGFIACSNNLPQFENFPVRDDIAARLGAPVILENDANAAALGERWMGAAQGVDDFALLTLGTGIGGGIVMGGHVLHGFAGMAGEFGHTTVSPAGNPCGCGNTGCLEKHASATALSAMARLMQLGDNLDGEQLYALAQGQGPEAAKARRIFETMGGWLGVALGNLVNIFNFPLYLLSGGVLAAWDLFAPSMLAGIERRSFTFRHTRTRIGKAALGAQAGLYGAAWLPFTGEL
jgi:glucokinase